MNNECNTEKESVDGCIIQRLGVARDLSLVAFHKYFLFTRKSLKGPEMMGTDLIFGCNWSPIRYCAVTGSHLLTSECCKDDSTLCSHMVLIKLNGLLSFHYLSIKQMRLFISHRGLLNIYMWTLSWRIGMVKSGSSSELGVTSTCCSWSQCCITPCMSPTDRREIINKTCENNRGEVPCYFPQVKKNPVVEKH